MACFHVLLLLSAAFCVANLFRSVFAVATGGMECLKNKECNTKYEHLCNMQNGLWTKNYVFNFVNGSTEGNKKAMLTFRTLRT